jgi:PKD repeat protein
MIRTYSLLALFITTIHLSAQHNDVLPCRHNDMDLLRPLHQDDPAALAQMALAEAELEAFTASFTHERGGGDDAAYIIPVVFHIIHEHGLENISDAQIYDAVRVLNEDMRRLNQDHENVSQAFIEIAADAGIEFRMARKDPQGNCTTGITRTVSALTNEGNQSMKQLIQWPRNRYLNVWVSASAGGAAGYTYRPGSVDNWAAADGIVLQHSYTGSIGTSSPNRSRTLTHEVGHWLNLLHTWGSGNTPALDSNCDMDDNVGDTPNTRGWVSCNINGSTCGSLDNVENYMDYSYCGKMFTQGQATRMLAALNSNTAQRSNLWQPANLSFTGVAGPGQLCAASFIGNAEVICAGTAIAFQDVSFHGVTSRTWQFPGGEPSTSTAEAPQVIYNEPGTYPVTLTVSDGSTTLTTTEVQQVTVLPMPGLPAQFSEGFEDAQLNNDLWTVVDVNGGNTFQQTTAAAFSGDKSIRIMNGASFSGQIDELVSTTFDMSNEDQISISFRYAFARRSQANDDRLKLFASPNCGVNWSLRRQLRGTMELATAPNTTVSFVPSGSGEWGYVTIDNFPPNLFTENFRFKLQFESHGGNNLYIDDININGMPVSVQEIGGIDHALQVVPNPVAGQAQLLYTMPQAGLVSMALLDVLGRELETIHQGMVPAGPQRMDLPVAALRSGMYFVRLSSIEGEQVVRFIVE